MLNFPVPNKSLSGFQNFPSPSKLRRGFPDFRSAVIKKVVSALWTPAEITTALWLDAADSDTITLISGTVSEWDDKSGNGRHFTQTTTTARPVVSIEALNSLDTLSLDGSNDHLISSYNLPDTFLVFFVARQTGQTSGGSILRPVVCASETGGDSAPLFFAGPQRDSEILDIGMDTTRIPTTAGSWEINESVVIAAHYNGTTLSGWKNGTSYGTINVSSGSFGPLYVGGDRSMFTERRFKGLIGEIVILPDTGDRQKIEGYLAHKWGLEANLPFDHPYKSTAPLIE